MNQERWVALAVAIALAIFGIAVSQILWKRLRLPLEPLSVFLLVWAGSLGLFAVPWIDYTHTSMKAWLAIYGSITAFTIAALAAYRLVPLAAEAEPRQLNHKRLVVAWATTFVLGLIGFAAFLRAVHASTGLSAVVLHPAQVRLAETTSPDFEASYGLWKTLTYFSLVSFLLWTIALREQVFRGRLAAIAPLGVLSISEFFFTGDRTLLGTALLWTGFFHLLWRPLRRPAHVAAAVGGIVVLCLIAFLGLGARLGKDISAFPEIRASLTTRHFQQAAPAYAYVTSSPPTLSKLMADPNAPHTEGALTMLPFVKAAHRTGIAGVPPDEIGGFYSVPFAMNLYSWLGFFYLDYGLAGCFVLPAFVGILGAAAAVRLGLRRTLRGAWLLALLLFVLVASPLGNKISSALTWELAAIGVFAPILESTRVVERRSVRSVARAVPHRASVAIAVVAIVFLTSIAVAIAATRAASVNPESVSDTADTLSTAAQRARRAYPTGNYPTSTALASQLHFSDPRLPYLGAEEGAPTTGTGIVYVTAQKGLLVLMLRLRNGTQLLDKQEVTDESVSFTQTILRPHRNLLKNPSFQRGIPGWRLNGNARAHLSFVRPTGLGRSTALRVTGTGRASPRPSFVVQTLDNLPRTEAGTRYELTLEVRTAKSVRPLMPELKLLYADGTYQFFTTLPRDDVLVPNQWHKARVLATAAKLLTGIEVFAADTGVRTRFRGPEWLSGARLVLIR